MDLGGKLKEIRIKRGFGINQLAIKSGVSASQISRIENNKRKPKVETLDKIAEGLNVDKAYMHKIAGIADEETVDLTNAIDNHEYMTYQGKEIDQQDIELIKRILRNR